jgi:hypothetical protein
LSYLIRVQLPDAPGTLGAVASAIGLIGADILSVEVVERGTGTAVDDLVIELPADRLPDSLITAAESVDGVVVDTVRPYAGVLDTHRELELVETIAAEAESGLELFAEGTPKLMRSGWAVIVVKDGDVIKPLASSSAAPESLPDELPWLPLPKAVGLDAEDEWVPQTWQDLGTELAASPLGNSNRAILVGRPGGPVFRASEVARLAHLAGIVAVVLDN